jgi:hypothetical protein
MKSRILARRAPTLLFGAVLTLSLGAIAGCMRPSYYDSVYADTHRWDSREDAAYRRWEAERQLQHLEFQARRDEEQREFWRWRHDHPDR